MASLPNSYWEEAVSTACYCQNQLFTTTLPQITPFEAWTGRKPVVHHMRIFGAPAYAYVPAAQRHKLADRATKHIFVGYGDRFGIKAYRLYNPKTRHFSFSRSVFINELALLPTTNNLTEASTSESQVATHDSTAELTAHLDDIEEEDDRVIEEDIHDVIHVVIQQGTPHPLPPIQPPIQPTPIPPSPPDSNALRTPLTIVHDANQT